MDRNRRQNQEKDAYIPFDVNSNKDIVNKINADNFRVVQKSQASSLAYNIDTTTSIRPPFGRGDYEYFRANEAIPYNFRDVIKACRLSYLKFGVIRNVIDMMTDFITEGMRFIHPDKKVEVFFKVWSQRVLLREAVSEFARHALIDANLVVKRTYAQLTKPVEADWMKNNKSFAAVEKLYKDDDVNKREIPWRYTFLNVAALEWRNSDVGKMTGKKELVFKMSKSLISALNSGNSLNKNAEKMPDLGDVITDQKNGYVKIDLDKVYVAHSKKDSWEDWAPPFLYAVLADLSFKEKLKQMDLSAADGVINVIRLWKLGDHTTGIFPSDAGINKLAGILENSTGGGAIDIIWDSLIDMTPYYPPIKDILGPEKFTQVDKDILIGLGVPEVLIGGKGANFSNSYIQLKTMVERLNHVRSMVMDWLNKEVKILCQAMDIESPPLVRFNFMALEDENTTKKLIVGLLDRGVVSVEAVLDAYGEDYLTEVQRITEEQKVFKKAGIEVKGPFDQPDAEAGEGGKGRPAATKDPSKRATRTPKVRTAEDQYTLFAKGVQIVDNIDEYLLPLFLESNKIKNARQMTAEHKEEFNLLRLNILSQFNEDTELSDVSIESRIQTVNKISLSKLKTNISSLQDSDTSVKSLRMKEVIAWSKLILESDNGS